MDVFKHVKITRWRHCNADSLKMLKANYNLIRLLCVYRMTKYVGKICIEIPSDCWENCKKSYGVTFMPHPVDHWYTGLVFFHLYQRLNKLLDIGDCSWSASCQLCFSAIPKLSYYTNYITSLKQYTIKPKRLLKRPATEPLNLKTFVAIFNFCKKRRMAHAGKKTDS